MFNLFFLNVYSIILAGVDEFISDWKIYELKHKWILPTFCIFSRVYINTKTIICNTLSPGALPWCCWIVNIQIPNVDFSVLVSLRQLLKQICCNLCILLFHSPHNEILLKSWSKHERRSPCVFIFRIKDNRILCKYLFSFRFELFDHSVCEIFRLDKYSTWKGKRSPYPIFSEVLNWQISYLTRAKNPVYHFHTFCQ